MLENECEIKMRAKNFPKKLVDNKKKNKGIEVKL